MVSIFLFLLGFLLFKISGIGLIAFAIFSKSSNYSLEDLFSPIHKLLWKKAKTEIITFLFGFLLMLVAVLLYTLFRI